MRELHRSPNAAKDQSYVLAVMGPERLARAVFPLGGFASKDEVRAEAARRGLSVSAKPDSYDICFVADGDTQGCLRARLGARAGARGAGEGGGGGGDEGAYAYTVGQRKGLGIDRPAPDGRPRYVLDVQPASNRVVVGPAELLSVARIEAGSAGGVGAARPPAGGAGGGGGEGRADGAPVPARVRAFPDGSIEVELTGTPLRGVAAGQSLVVYAGPRVLGQGPVARADRAGRGSGAPRARAAQPTPTAAG